jgi:hypothetical protein
LQFGGSDLARGRVNILALLGGLVGVIAICTQWIVEYGFYIHNLTNTPLTAMRFLITHNDLPYHSIFWISLLLFFIGVIATFVSPLGGFLQLSGIGLFIYYFQDIFAGWYPGVEDSISLGVGLFFGSLSSLIVIVSFLRPIGVNCGGPFSLRDRHLTIDPSREAPNVEASSRDVRQVLVFLAIAGGLLALVYGLAAPEIIVGARTSLSPANELACKLMIVWGLAVTILGVADILLASYLRLADNSPKSE